MIGLGAMGRALAAAFLASGHPTTVWNRTPGRAGELVGAGAAEAPTVAAAIEPGRLTVVCVLDRAAVEDVLAAAGERLRGATIVDLTSSTPEDARALSVAFEAGGARYLAGAIMVPTPVVGTPDALVLYSGDRTVLAEHQATLAALGGRADLLGEDPGLAAIHDLGMLGVFFGGMASFLHAAALVGAEGVRATTFLPYARAMLRLLDATFGELAGDVDARRHPGVEDNLAMELAVLDQLVAATTARGLDATLPAAVRDLARTAVERGYGGDGFSRVVDVVRRPAA